MAREEVRNFIDKFMPDIAAPDETMSVIPHSLLFDFNGDYTDVRFSIQQLKDCIVAYLDLIPAVKTALTSADRHWVDAGELYTCGHDNASELLLAYFGRTVRDDADYPST